MVTQQSETIGAIAGAIAAASVQIGSIAKDKRMSAGPARYEYLSDEAIVAKAQRILADNGLAVSPAGMAQIDTPDYGRNQTPGMRIVVTWRVLHTSGEWLTMQTIGEGMDSGDKVANKCMTAARKYLFRLLFSIGTGDDPDDERLEHAPRQAERNTPAPSPAPAAAAAPARADPVREAQRAVWVWVRANDPGYLDRAKVLKDVPEREISRALDCIELDRDEAIACIRRLIDAHTQPGQH